MPLVYGPEDSLQPAWHVWAPSHRDFPPQPVPQQVSPDPLRSVG